MKHYFGPLFYFFSCFKRILCHIVWKCLEMQRNKLLFQEDIRLVIAQLIVILPVTAYVPLIWRKFYLIWMKRYVKINLNQRRMSHLFLLFWSIFTMKQNIYCFGPYSRWNRTFIAAHIGSVWKIILLFSYMLWYRANIAASLSE